MYNDWTDKLITTAIAITFIGFGLFITVGTYLLYQEQSIKIEQLKQDPKKALYKNINFELKQGATNDKI